jgi:hypothetical protein
MSAAFSLLPRRGRGTAPRSGVVEGNKGWAMSAGQGPSTAFGGPTPRLGEERG